MKIVSLTDSLGQSAGGLSHATFNLASSVASCRPNYSVSILCHQDVEEIDGKKSSFANVNVIKVPCFRNSLYPFSFQLKNRLYELQPDLVHLRGLWRQGSLVALKWKTKNPTKKLIVQPAGMLEPWARRRKKIQKLFFYRLAESRLFDICDSVHATSPAESRNLIDVGIPAHKIFLIEEGIFMPPQVKALTSKQSSVKTLLFLSRIHPKKGIELLLDALALLRPTGWQCRIVGMGSGKYVQALKVKAKSLYLDDLVFFDGPLYGQDKANSFRQANAFILPTYSENFGIAVAEAMSWGLPVITTTETPWSVLSAKDMGWYVKPELHCLSQALFQLFQKPSYELAIMGNNCRDYVSHNYSWSSIGMRMAAHYDFLMS